MKRAALPRAPAPKGSARSLVAGVGLVGYPRDYGSSGVMTFIVNHNGTVFQKDLGPGDDARVEDDELGSGQGMGSRKP